MNLQQNLAQSLEDLRQGKLNARQAYHTLHEFGRQNFFQARSEVEHNLKSKDPTLRKVALEVLTRHWRLLEHWDTSRNFLEHDPDVECRLQGASGLEILKRNTQDHKTLSLLAHVVRNEGEKLIVREAAYAAMRGVLHYEPQEQFRIASKGLDWGDSIDWSMVDSYL